MSTRSALFVQTDDGSWLEHYCHYDGYPRHMLPALNAACVEDILAAKEIRAVDETGSVEPLSRARAPRTVATPRFPDWADHTYALTPTGWKYAGSRAALAALIA